MSERYYITGVQLGMLLAFAKDGGMYNEAHEIVDEVIDKQFIGNVKNIDELPSEMEGENG